MPIFEKKRQISQNAPILILGFLFLFSVCALFYALPTQAQDKVIIVNIDQGDQAADFTVENSISIYLSGTFESVSYTGLVYFGIQVPDGWEYSINIESKIMTAGEKVPFEGEVRPNRNSEQQNHQVFVWASADTRNYGDVDWTSDTSNRSNIIIDLIKNRVVLISDVIEQRILPSSTITYTFSVTNAATVEDIFLVDLYYNKDLINQGWSILPSENNFTLIPQDMKMIFLEVQIPDDAPEGDYEIIVEVTSEGHAASKGEQSIVTKVRTPETPSPFRVDWMILFMVGFVGFGIGLAAFLGATEVGYFSLISLFLPLYVRLKKKDVLSHFTRGQIFGYIQANPGTHYNAIIQDLRLHNGVGAYHLQVLEREGFIRSLRDGIYKRFYPSTMRIPEKRVHLSRIQRDVFEVIQKHPGITQKQISRLLDESKQVVNYHVKILEGAGLIRLERAGRETACFAGKVNYVPEEDVYQLADEQGAAQVMRM